MTLILSEMQIRLLPSSPGTSTLLFPILLCQQTDALMVQVQITSVWFFRIGSDGCVLYCLALFFNRRWLVSPNFLLQVLPLIQFEH